MRTREQEGEWGQTNLSQPSLMLSKSNDSSSRTCWEQILLSSESPGEGGWKITLLPVSGSQAGTRAPWSGQHGLGCATSWRDTWAILCGGLLRPGS